MAAVRPRGGSGGGVRAGARSSVLGVESPAVAAARLARGAPRDRCRPAERGRGESTGPAQASRLRTPRRTSSSAPWSSSKAAAREQGSASSGETYPFSGPVFVLTHEPPDPPDPEVTFLIGDIGKAVATARSAAGGKNLEILGADVAGQCLRRGLVDEILVYVLPVLLGDGVRFSAPGVGRIDLEPLSSTRSGAVTVLRFRVRKVPVT